MPPPGPRGGGGASQGAEPEGRVQRRSPQRLHANHGCGTRVTPGLAPADARVWPQPSKPLPVPYSPPPPSSSLSASVQTVVNAGRTAATLPGPGTHGRQERGALCDCRQERNGLRRARRSRHREGTSAACPAAPVPSAGERLARGAVAQQEADTDTREAPDQPQGVCSRARPTPKDHTQTIPPYDTLETSTLRRQRAGGGRQGWGTRASTREVPV